jgi:WD40 repeat protein
MNPSGDLLCLSGENEIDLFDVSTGKPSGDPLKAEKTESTTSLAVSPDSELLAQGTKDGKVILWNLRQRSRIGSPLDLGMKGMVTGVAFSPDSRVLATAKFSELRLWDVSTREPMGESFVGHEKRRLIWSVAFSPDGKILASGAFDGTTVLWDLASRRQLVRLHGHVGRVFGAAFSLDGKLLATSGEDKKVLLWQVDPASWERIACSIVNRNFNQVEWKEFTGGYPYVKTCPDLPSSHDAKSDNSQSQQ